MLFLDLNGCKAINDTLGHAAGNALLIAAAARLLGSVRPGDTVARLGGDEFALLLEPLQNRGIAAELARRIATVLDEPASLAEGETPVVGSVGIAISHPGESAEHLFAFSGRGHVQRQTRRTGRSCHGRTFHQLTVRIVT